MLGKNVLMPAFVKYMMKEITQKDPKERPIYFLSHKLSPTQTQWPPIEHEAYAIFYALKKLDQYLHDAQFVIKTDHKPLKGPFEYKIRYSFGQPISGAIIVM